MKLAQRGIEVKGTFFQKPLEFRLSVDGETWRQGDPITGTLTVKNHSPEPLPTQEITVRLARATLRKVHQKLEGAFETAVGSAAPPSDASTLAPGAEFNFPWKFVTDRNCPITDSVSSLFLLYGKGEDGMQMGQLQVPVIPYEVISQFLDVMKTAFRFVLKTTKWSKGSVDAKLAPPDSRNFVGLEQAVISFHFEGEVLQVDYDFKLKKIEASASAVELKKQKTSFSQSYEPALYRTPSGRFDHERVEKEIGTILSQVESKTFG